MTYLMFLVSNCRRWPLYEIFLFFVQVTCMEQYFDGCDDIIACLLLGNLYGTGAIIRPITHDLGYSIRRSGFRVRIA
ncbi:hypothetical protein C0J52_08316 [Blattella germanica]|nr:hypothetical protein C0J52_08316 [Blattella germanica]